MKLSVNTVSSSNVDGCSCSILTVESAANKKLSIMIDCGVNQRLEMGQLKKHHNKIAKVNLILLSQSSVEFCGGIPILLNNHMVNAKAPIFATSPLVDYGFRNFMDQYLTLQNSFMRASESTEADEEFQSIHANTLEAFSTIHRLNFGQKQVQHSHHRKSFSFVDNYFQVSIQPIRAGKSIGACAWKISINMITVVFVTDFSTLKELHVDPIAVDRLLSHTNQTHQCLGSQQIDFLMINHNVQKEAQPAKAWTVSQRIADALGQSYKKKNCQLILAFYPNERILEGIMAIDSILYEFPELQGQLKCDLVVSYRDVIEKARGQTDFLGSSLVNWRHQETNHQTPLDPEYLRQRFLSIKTLGDVEKGFKSDARIVMTSYNNLFSGPFSVFFNEYLSNPQNIVILFGQPNSSMFEGLQMLKTGFKGQIETQAKKQDSINYNALKKILLNKRDVVEAPAFSESQGMSLLATTQKRNFDSSSNMSVDQAKSADVLTEESLNTRPMDNLEQEMVIEVFDRPSDFEQFKPSCRANEYALDQLNFTNEKRTPFTPLSELFGREPYGIESAYQYRHQTALLINNQLEQMESESEENSVAEHTHVTVKKEPVVEYPRRLHILPMVNFQANLMVMSQSTPAKTFTMLIEQLGPKHIHFLHPIAKKLFANMECQITSTQNKETLSTYHYIDLPFLQANQSELKENVTRVRVCKQYKCFKGKREGQRLVQIQRHDEQDRFRLARPQDLQLILLFKHLREQNIQVQSK